MNKELENMYIDLIEDNVNVSKTTDGKEFLILLAGVFGIILLIILFGNLISNIFISNMSDKTQMRIEKMMGELPKDNYLSDKYKKPYESLVKTRRDIIQKDKSLEGKSSFPIIFEENKDFNAWVMPNGVITFTTSMLDKNLSDEELAFVLAHEIGHYKNRDHLKTISRQIVISLALQIFTGSSNADFSSLANTMSEMNFLNHSRTQESNADKYASSMLIQIYGNNEGGIKFLNRLNELENYPELFSYFSTHPATKKRLKNINPHK